MSFQKKNEIDILTLGAAMSAGGGGGTGDGDMKKAVYDTNNDGVVDAADTANSVSGHTVAKDVPADAVFTDTVYDDTALSGRVTALESHVTQSGDVVDSDGHSLHIVGEAIETDKTVSGNPIVITDALPVPAKSLITEIEPIQDLHGYDHPWVGGAGKNLLSESEFTTAASGANYARMSIMPALHVGDTLFFSAKQSDGVQLDSNTTSLRFYDSDNTIITYVGADRAITIDESTIGTAYLVVYTSATLASKTIQAQLELGSTATSYAPYSNICPISGRTEIRVDDHGKNYLPMTVAAIKAANTSGTWDGNAYTYSGITYTLLTDADGNITGIDADGTASSYSMLSLCSNFAFGSGTNLIVTDGTLDSASNTFNIRVGNSTDAYVASTIGGETSFTADTTNYIRIAVQNNVTLSHKIFKPMVRLSTVSDPTFAPYKSSSVTIQLGQTVYGAKINFKTGEGIVDKAIVNMGNLGWSYDSGLGAFISDGITADAKKPPTNNDKTDTICSVYPVVDRNHLVDFSLCLNTNARICVKDSTYGTDYAAFKTAMTGQTICYELATPTTLQLTPAQLQMLKGYNRVTIDNGAITLTYRANKADSVQAEIDVLETTKADNADVADYIENGNTASRAYTANQFMLWKGDLYKVTTSIASGATITAGTNVSKTTIGAVLTAILNA